VREVWVSGAPGADHYVDVTDTFGRKVAALRAHESQTAHMDNLEEMLRGWLTRTAERGGLPAGRLAEMFQVLETG
jgi:LmbE family N-acetylglucosaminyl deacetylase